MKLYLDTSNNLKTVVKLNDQELIKEYESPRDQDVMGALLELLGKTQSKITDVTAIEVETGPGSFTGLRVGISIANTLGMALGIPVNGKKVGDLVFPEYGKEANISTGLGGLDK